MRRTVVALVLVGLAACGGGGGGSSDLPTFPVHSSAFDDGGAVPAKYSCDGDGVVPPIGYDAPRDTKGIAITIVDPDAHDYVHWIDVDGIEGKHYRPLCPPPGERHHYVFTVWALDAAGVQPTLGAIEDHAVAKGEMTGTYERTGDGSS
jgi:phosphatidylethanolamine-binding protein (PEBP) family uncharacterized protein